MSDSALAGLSLKPPPEEFCRTGSSAHCFCVREELEETPLFRPPRTPDVDPETDPEVAKERGGSRALSMLLCEKIKTLLALLIERGFRLTPLLVICVN